MNKVIFSKSFENNSVFELCEFNLKKNYHIIFNWLQYDYNNYWEMKGISFEKGKSIYQKLINDKHYKIYMGIHNKNPAFFTELYSPEHSEIDPYIDVEKGKDLGMHLFISKSNEPISNFTSFVFQTVLEFIFNYLGKQRVIVEPNIKNEKVIKKNKHMGFKELQTIELANKKALLSTCTKTDYKKALSKFKKTNNTTKHLNTERWEQSERFLLAKALREFTHELLIKPIKIEENKGVYTYKLSKDDFDICYTFKCRHYGLDHWQIDSKSIIKEYKGNRVPLSISSFICEFQKELEIPDKYLGDYIQEIINTKNSICIKLANKETNRNELLYDLGFQHIETNMFEGHPIFIANSGKVGYTQKDLFKYGPESENCFSLVWLAVDKQISSFKCISSLEYESFIKMELGDNLYRAFQNEIYEQNIDPKKYYFIPIHPWQWENIIQMEYAKQIAKREIIEIGPVGDLYTAQQSIRTLFNQTNPKKCYVKSALSITNMGFVRGMSVNYMEGTPEITKWIKNKLDDDSFLKSLSFRMLDELATFSVLNENYKLVDHKNPCHKVFATLWRESPVNYISDKQKLATMASLLHFDSSGEPFIKYLIKISGKSTYKWLKQYLNCYLIPLLHCYYKHKIVFLPHGENTIIALEDGWPISCFMKDITEEIAYFGSRESLPDKVKRIHIKTTTNIELMSFFIDIFDCFYRMLVPILDEHLNFKEYDFWKLVYDQIRLYQDKFPELEQQFKKASLFSKYFKRSCCNRLQLRNCKHMVNLANPTDSLIFYGELKNPLYIYDN